jgi:hypothetical protein
MCDLAALAECMPDVSPLEHLDAAVAAVTQHGGDARVTYVSYVAKSHGALHFARLSAAVRRSKFTQSVRICTGSPSAIGKKRPSVVAFCLASCASHGKASVRITLKASSSTASPSSHIEVHAHTDAAGVPEVNASIQRILAHAGSRRLETWSVRVMQLYWFWGRRLELDAVHREVLEPGACLDARATRDERRVRITTPHVSASVAECGTISVVCKCAPTLRRVARELSVVLARSHAEKKVACTKRA